MQEKAGTVTDEVLRPGDTALAPRRVEEPALSPTPLAQELPGRYQLGAELARGGQSVVYVAYDAHLGREVAFKTLLPKGAGSASATLSTRAARFVREARVTAQLEHPGIAPVHEVGQRADGSFYATQKLVRGKTLESLLAACASPAERFRLLPAYLGLCQAVAYAHERGVIHRDLKPGNLMVGALGEAVVIDWGLARTHGQEELGPDAPPVESLLDDPERTRDGAIIGTPSYMSPEQAVGASGQVDARSDVWSLGIILYELLAGRRAFGGGSIAETLLLVATAAPPPVRQASPDVPPELAAVVERALQRDPRKRYPSAAELASEVSRWLSGDRVVAYEYRSWELVQRFVRRNVASTVLAALVVVALAVFGLVTRARYLDARRQLAESFARLGDVAGDALRWDEAATWYAAARGQEDSLRARLGLAHARTLAPQLLGSHHLEGLRVSGFCDLPDGGLRAVALGESGARLLEGETGEVLARYPQEQLSFAGCAPDADRLVTVSGPERGPYLVRQWTLAGEPVGTPWTLESLRVPRIAEASRDGRLLALLGDYVGIESSSLVLHALDDGKLLLRAPAGATLAPLRGHHLTWVDSRRRLWHFEPDAGAPLAGREVAGHPSALRQLDGDETLVATTTGLVQRVPRDAARTGYTGSSGQPFGVVGAVTLGPRARWLATGHESGVTLWSWSDGRPAPTSVLGWSGSGRLALSSDESRLVAAFNHGPDSSLSEWRLPERGGDVLSTLTTGVDELSPDGRRLAFRDRSRRIHVVDLPTGSELAVIPTSIGFDRAQLTSFSTGGGRFAVVQEDRVEVYELDGPSGPRVVGVHPAAMNFAPAQLSPDGTLLLGAAPPDAPSGTLRLIRVGEPDPVWTRKLEAEGAAFTADGRHIAVCGAGRIALLDTATGEVARRWTIPAEGTLVRVALSADGQTLVAGGSAGVWRVDVGADRVTRLAPDCVGLSVAISADGAWIASSSTRVSLWHRSSDAPVLTFPEEGQPDFVALSPDGRTLYHAGRYIRREHLSLAPTSIAPESELAEVLLTYHLAFDGQRVVPATAP
jgi:tRNA A-37 threonylcarbamoyl transferase component Bud32/WD40 repeat protein